MSKELTVRDAAKVFLPLAGLFVVGFLIIALGGSEPTPRPAVTLSEPLQRDLWRMAITLLAGGLIIAVVALVVRHRGRTPDSADAKQLRRENVALIGEKNTWQKRAADAQDQNASLQAINAALIDERNAAEQRVKELERAEAMHHQAMLSKQEELDKAGANIKNLLTRNFSLQEQIAEQEDEQSAPASAQHIVAAMRYALTAKRITVRGAREFIREQGIAFRNDDYPILSAFVKEANTLPHHDAPPVRTPATETNAANARRERIRTRSRTQARTMKARKA